MNPLDLLILALATWRLAYMIAKEDGPWSVFEHLRKALPLGGLTTCIYCLSLWMAVGMYVILSTALAPLVYIFAISGAALMFHRYTGGDLI